MTNFTDSHRRSRRLRRASLGAGALLAATPALAAAAAFAGAGVPRQTDTAAHGVVPVKVSCPAATSGGCTGKLALTSAKKIAGRTQPLGSATFSLTPGQTGKVKVKLDSDGRRLLKHGTITPVATVASRDGAGHRATQSRKIKVTSSNGTIYGGY